MGGRNGRVDRPRAGTCALLLALIVAAPASAASLPSVPSGHRPGPDALYEPAAKAPQLENTGPWKAKPILVSGAEAYRSGEYLYQDYLYDDHGAAKSRDLTDPWGITDFLFSSKAGTLTYPTGPDFANNGADLVELRAKPVAGATAFRVTLNTLKDPARTAFTIAIGDSEAKRSWPHAAGVVSPAEVFLTVHGTTGELTDAATGAGRGAAEVKVDLARRQFDVRVPRSAFDPGSGAVRLAAGVGVWDTAAGHYATPQFAASGTRPGGGNGATAALFNVAFRFDEPYPDVSTPIGGYTIGDSAVGAGIDGSWWRERMQADALAQNDVSRFYTEVDFAKLAQKARTVTATRRVKACTACKTAKVRLPARRGRRLVKVTLTYRGKKLKSATGRSLKTVKVTRPTAKAFTVGIRARTNPLPKADDNQGVPKTGSISRIVASHNSFGQGFIPGKLCGGLTGFGNVCDGPFAGHLQPYTLYVPRKPVPRNGWGMTLLLHSLGANYNQYANSKNQSQLGLRGPGSLVATPLGRGPDGAYKGAAEADTFEVWADVARNYKLDADWSAVSGYSMGGGGTYRYLERYPDLFARGAAVVGPSANPGLPSLRNTPIISWFSLADELVNIGDSESTTNAMIAAKIRFVNDLFLVSDHLTLATNDEYGPQAAFLGTHRVDRNPAHVTYVVEPDTYSAKSKVVADHAYWVSGVKIGGAAELGEIDVRSEGFGVGDPVPGPVKTSNGVLLGGSRGTMPFLQRERAWGPVPKTPVADKLVVTSNNIATATIDTARAKVSCSPQIELHGVVALSLTCPARSKKRCGTRLKSIRVRAKGPNGKRRTVTVKRRYRVCS